ncbi:MAG: hypothetical protein R3C20_12255 [Planctomycetaceae bacterium]
MCLRVLQQEVEGRGDQSKVHVMNTKIRFRQVFGWSLIRLLCGNWLYELLFRWQTWLTAGYNER